MAELIKPSHNLIRKLDSFTETQQKHIFQNSFAFQLTEGCSLGCFDCGNGALKGVRDYVPPQDLEHILKKNKNIYGIFIFTV